MELNQYQKMAMRTMNKEQNSEQLLLNGVMGLCGESGEVIDIVKKSLSDGRPLDKAHIVEELGDVAWYLAETAQVLGFTLEEICQKNLDKLNARFPDGFASERSIHRK